MLWLGKRIHSTQAPKEGTAVHPPLQRRGLSCSTFCNLGVVDRYGSDTLKGFECLLNVFAQHPRDGITMMTGEFGNLDIGPAFVLEASKSLIVP